LIKKVEDLKKNVKLREERCEDCERDRNTLLEKIKKKEDEKTKYLKEL
jgi:hypothetical protein